MAIEILATDRNLNVIGDPITGWTDLDVTLRFNEPASGTVTVPITQTTLDVVQPGNRLVVIRDGKVFCAGPIEKPGPQKWSVDGQDSPPGTLTIAFSDDLAPIAGRITYPNPAQPITAQTVDRWTTTAPADDIIRNLVNVNAGPGAVAARRIPRLVIAPDDVTAPTVTTGTRLEPLCDVLRSTAIAGGGLGFRTVQVDNNIEFQVYQPRDLTGSVVYSATLGNLRSYSYDPEAPTATVAIVGGADEGADRQIVERINTPAVNVWWRLETFVDQRQADDEDPNVVLAELNQAGDEALARGAETARLSTVTVDIPTQRYGEHYDLGDRVTVVLATGLAVTDVVRAVHLQATPGDGELITALVGSQDASSDPQWLTYMRDLARRLGRLETR